jgi:hypothetical protein
MPMQQLSPVELSGQQRQDSALSSAAERHPQTLTASGQQSSDHSKATRLCLMPVQPHLYAWRPSWAGSETQT